MHNDDHAYYHGLAIKGPWAVYLALDSNRGGPASILCTAKRAKQVYVTLWPWAKAPYASVNHCAAVKYI